MRTGFPFGRLIFHFALGAAFGLAGVEAAAQDSFTALNGIVGGEIRSIKINSTSGRVFATTNFDRRLYTSDDNGATWAQSALVSANDILVDGDKLHYIDYSYFYTSTDNGATWTVKNPLSQFSDGDQVHRLPVSGDVFVMNSCRGVYVSPDAGVTWKNIASYSTCGVSNFEVAYTNNGDIYFTSPEAAGILQHKFVADGTWDAAKVTTVLPKLVAGNDFGLTVAVTPSNKILATYSNAANDAFLMSSSTTGNTGSWSSFNTPAPSEGWRADGGNLYANNPTTGKLYTNHGQVLWELSDEASQTWTLKVSPQAQYSTATMLSMTWKNATEAYAGISGSGVFRTTDGGATWAMRNGTAPGAIMSPTASDIEILANGTIVVREEGGPKGVWTSSDNGSTFVWQPQAFTFYGASWGQKMCKLQDNSLIMDSSDGLRRTTDGTTWSKQSGTSYATFITVGASQIYGLGNDNQGFGLSTDVAATWTPIAINGLPGSYWLQFAAKVNSNFFVALANNTNNKMEYWKLDTSTTPWNATVMITPLNSLKWTCVGFFEMNGKLYGSDGEKIAYSSDEGVTWTTINFQHNAMVPIRQGAGGFAVSASATFSVTQDDGKTWRNLALPGRYTSVRDLVQDAAGNFYAFVNGAPIGKYESKLILSASELPPALNFTWQPLAGGPFGGNVRKILKNSSNQLFALGNEALFKQNTVAQRWDRLTIPNHFDYTEDAIIDNAGKIYIIVGHRLQYSSDAGATWTTAAGQFQNARKLAKAGNGNLVVASDVGIWLSTNEGQSFAKPATANAGAFRKIEVSTSGTLLAEKRENDVSTLMKSVDHGTTWTALSVPDLSAGKEVYSITQLETDALALVTTDNVYKTTDDGITWTSMKGDLPLIANTTDYYNRGFSKVYKNPTASEYYFANQASIYKTVNDGVNWTKVTDTPNLVTDVQWLNAKLYISTDVTGVSESTDGGQTRAPVYNNKGLSLLSANNIYATDSKLFFSAYGGRFVKSHDGGQTFIDGGATTYTDRTLVTSTGKIISYGGGVSSSDDGGETWTNHNAEGYFIAIATKDGSKYYGYRDLNGTISFVESTNLTDWTVIPVSGTVPCGLGEIRVGPSDGIYFRSWCGSLYVVRFGSLIKIEEITNVSTVQVVNDKLYVHSTTGGIYESDDGVTWTRKSAPTGYDFFVTNNLYYFIGHQGTGELWLSRDQGKSWQNVGGFMGDTFIKVIVDEGTGYAYAIAESQPMLKSSTVVLPNDNTGPTIAGLSPEDDEQSVPKDFSLSITFNEPVKAVAGKKLRIFASSQPSISLEVFDINTAIFSNTNKTIALQPTTTIDYLKEYFVTIDNGALTDIFGNAFAGITNATTWNFTTLDEPDTQSPGIAFTTSDLEVGQTKTFEITVTDNKAIAQSNTKIFYRGTATPADAVFQSASLSATGTATATNTKFAVTASESWYDKQGLEFYFEAEDVTGNKQRSPAAEDTYYYSYISFGTAKPKIAGLSFGENETSYRIISIPYKLVDNKIETLFGELGEANADNWRLLTYAGNGTFDEYPDKLKTISRGKGYWFLQKSFNEIFVENASTPQNNRTDFITLELQPKWNQIGNPYPVPISWQETRAGQESTVGVVKKFSSGYTNGDVLEAFEGGFVYVKGTANVSLKVRFKGTTSGGRVTDYFFDDPQNWMVPLFLEQGDLINQVASIGMHKDASEDLDLWDDFNPPPLSRKLEVSLPTISNQVLAKNIVPLKPLHEWPMQIHAEKGLVQLTWPRDGRYSSSKDLVLLDEQTQTVTDMGLEDHYIFEGKAINDFKIYYGDGVKDRLKPTRTILGEPTPNPSSGKTTFRFTVAEGAQNTLAIEIYNSMGQRVASPVQGNFASGFYSYEWEHPEKLATGIYFCRLRTQGETQIKKMLIH